MTTPFDVPVLQGSVVGLEPLSKDHVPDLAVTAEEDRSTYTYTLVPRAQEVEAYLRAHFQRPEDGKLVPFAQVRQSDG